jgi:hypothetical protein
MENIHKLIDRYEENYDFVNNAGNDEKFKWEAVRGFRNVWFNETAASKPFAERFRKATKFSSVLIDNSIVSPTQGIVKMAEQRPKDVEALFQDVLFADYTTIDELQEHMNLFIEGTEKIRQDVFPKFYRYKQDRHAASCYLAFYKPEQHFMYRYSEAEMFAQYAGYGKDLGSGATFKLANYYELAEATVTALMEHKSLLQKYDALFRDDPQYYYDESLHVLAFDLMYCCRAYNFYLGLEYVSKKERLKAYTAQQLKEQEDAERQSKILELETNLHEVTMQIERYEEISLLGVEVSQAKHGVGHVIAQNDNIITVQFTDETVSYEIHRDHSWRPRFEDDETIVEAFTELEQLRKDKKKLEKELLSLQ